MFMQNYTRILWGTLTIALVGILIWAVLPRSAQAVTGSASSSGTVSGTVALSITDSSISQTNLQFSGANTGTIDSETRYLFDSEHDGVASADSISFNEDTTNVKVYYYISIDSFTGPSGTTPNVNNWMFFKDTSNSIDPDATWDVSLTAGAYGTYIVWKITGTTAAYGGSITPPSGFTPTWELTPSVTYLASNDGNTWNVGTITLYIVGDSSTIYVDDDEIMDEATETGYNVQQISATGDQIDVLGNKFVLTSSIPSGSGSTLTFNFGWFSDETANTNVGGTTFSFYTLLAIPFGPAGTYSASITITGTEQT